MDTAEISALSRKGPFTYSVGVGDDFQMTVSKSSTREKVVRQGLLNAAEIQARKKLTKDFAPAHSIRELERNIIPQDSLDQYQSDGAKILDRLDVLVEKYGGWPQGFSTLELSNLPAEKWNPGELHRDRQEFGLIVAALDADGDLKKYLLDTFSMKDFQAILTEQEKGKFSREVGSILRRPNDRTLGGDGTPSIVALSEAVKEAVADNGRWPQSGHFPISAFTVVCADKDDRKVTNALNHDHIQSVQIETIPLGTRAAGYKLGEIIKTKLSENARERAVMPVWGKYFKVYPPHDPSEPMSIWEESDHASQLVPTAGSTKLLLMLVYALERGYAFDVHESDITKPQHQAAACPFEGKEDLKLHLNPFSQADKSEDELWMNARGAFREYFRSVAKG